MGLFSFFKKKSSELKLGDFTLNEQVLKGEVDGEPIEKGFRNYEGKCRLFGGLVGISFDPDEVKENLDEYLGRINMNIDWINKNKKRIELEIIEEYLPIKNESWLEEGEHPINADEFRSKLSIESIRLFDDASYELYFEDGDLFWGHILIYSGNSKNETGQVYMAG